MSNTPQGEKKTSVGFYAFMGLMLAGFVAIFGFVVYLMFQ